MCKRKGFTLIELLVAVALMLILVGALARIFKHTSDAMLLADATMTITQNGRAMLETMSRDLASVQVGPDGTGPYLTVRRPQNNVAFLEFDTITSWRDPDADLGTGEGVRRIRYVARQDTRGRWTLWRGVRNNPDTGYVDRVFAQYVEPTGNEPKIHIEYYWDNSPATPRSGDEDFLSPDRNNNPPLNATDRAAYDTIYDPDLTDDDKLFDDQDLPSGVRLTIVLTDRRGEVTRTFSQVLWIATGVR